LVERDTLNEYFTKEMVTKAKNEKWAKGWKAIESRLEQEKIRAKIEELKNILQMSGGNVEGEIQNRITLLEQQLREIENE